MAPLLPAGAVLDTRTARGCKSGRADAVASRPTSVVTTGAPTGRGDDGFLLRRCRVHNANASHANTRSAKKRLSQTQEYPRVSSPLTPNTTVAVTENRRTHASTAHRNSATGIGMRICLHASMNHAVTQQCNNHGSRARDARACTTHPQAAAGTCCPVQVQRPLRGLYWPATTSPCYRTARSTAVSLPTKPAGNEPSQSPVIGVVYPAQRAWPGSTRSVSARHRQATRRALLVHVQHTRTG